MNTKSNIRTQFLSNREALSPRDQKELSEKICTRILSSSLYRSSKCIGLYQAIGREVNLQAVCTDALNQNKQVYLPVIQPQKTMAFIRFDTHTHLARNRFNILEPAGEESISIEALDILFVPLVAFDRTGTRLGRGQGYYDKALTPHKPKKIIGVAYGFQYYPKDLPHDAWDAPLDAIITEEAIISFN